MVNWVLTLVVNAMAVDVEDDEADVDEDEE